MRGDTCADKARDFIGKGTRVESRRVREPWRTAHSLGFYGDGISFRVVFGQSFEFSLSWWCTHRSAKMDASERDSGKWMDTRMSPLDLSRTLPVGGGLLVLYSLSGSPVIKQLLQMVTMVPG